MKPNISSRDLEALLALAQTLNFSRASGRVNMSQSAYSSLIARVEEMLESRLFVRTTRTVEMTQSGQVFVRHADAILSDMQRLVEAVREAETRLQGRVVFSTLPSLAAEVLPEIIERFHAQHPGIRVTMHDVQYESAIKLLRERTVDFALIGANPGLNDLRYQEITHEPFVAVMSEHHPLAARRKVSMDEIVKYPQIAISNSHSISAYVDAAFIARGLHFSAAHRVENLSTIGALLPLDGCLALLPVRAARLATVAAGTFRPLREAIRRPIGLSDRVDAVQSSASLAMMDIMKQVLHDRSKAFSGGGRIADRRLRS